MCPLSSVTAEPCAGPSVFCGFPLLCETHRTRSHNLCLFDSLKWSHLLVFFRSLETRKETGVQVAGNESRAPRSCRLARCCLQPARVPAREIRAKRMSQDVPRGTHNTDAHCTVGPNLNLTNCFSPDEQTPAVLPIPLLFLCGLLRGARGPNWIATIDPRAGL